MWGLQLLYFSAYIHCFLQHLPVIEVKEVTFPQIASLRKTETWCEQKKDVFLLTSSLWCEVNGVRRGKVIFPVASAKKSERLVRKNLRVKGKGLLQGHTLSIALLSQWSPCPHITTTNMHLAPCASGTDFSISITDSECLLITRHKHSPTIHRRHYSGTNQEPEKDNASWKTTRVLITDTLSHAYWLSPQGTGKISRTER